MPPLQAPHFSNFLSGSPWRSWSRLPKGNVPIVRLPKPVLLCCCRGGAGAACPGSLSGSQAHTREPWSESVVRCNKHFIAITPSARVDSLRY